MSIPALPCSSSVGYAFTCHNQAQTSCFVGPAHGRPPREAATLCPTQADLWSLQVAPGLQQPAVWRHVYSGILLCPDNRLFGQHAPTLALIPCQTPSGLQQKSITPLPNSLLLPTPSKLQRLACCARCPGLTAQLLSFAPSLQGYNIDVIVSKHPELVDHHLLPEQADLSSAAAPEGSADSQQVLVPQHSQSYDWAPPEGRMRSSGASSKRRLLPQAPNQANKAECDSQD